MLEEELVRALAGDTLQGKRMVLADMTRRDQDFAKSGWPALAAGAGDEVVLNNVRADGSLGKAFCWGVYGFGWGSGEF